MKKFCCNLLLLFQVCILTGCVETSGPAVPQSPMLPVTAEVLPPAQKDPAVEIKAAEKPVPLPTEIKKPAPAPVPAPVIRKEPAVEIKTIPAPEKKIPAPPPAKIAPPPHRSAPEKFRRGAGVWQAFSRLTPKKQQELMVLQRKDPEKFRRIMLEKADELYARERARRKELNDLAQKYRDSADAKQKNTLKNELRQKLLLDFQQRLQDSRRDLESNRARLKRMETELTKREKNRDAIVNAMLEKYISNSAATK